MNRVVLNFPSKEKIAEFILGCKINDVETDMNYLTVTGAFTDDCLATAIKTYRATVCERSDYTN